MTSLNQIINKLEQIATNHAQINGFGFGEEYEISTQQENYPLLWANVLDSTLNDKILTVGIGILILDIVSDDDRNANDTLSDGLSIACDVYALLAQENPLYEVQPNVNLTPIFEAFADKVNGWRMDLTLNIVPGVNRCQVPLK
jgi:hypothetical protein